MTSGGTLDGGPKGNDDGGGADNSSFRKGSRPFSTTVRSLVYLGLTPLMSCREVVSLPVEALQRTYEYTKIFAVGKW